MEKRRALQLIVLTCFLVVLLVPKVTWAEGVGQDGILPGPIIDSPFYSKHKPDEYIIDYVPKEDPDWDDYAHHLFTIVNEALDWQFGFYAWLAEFSIRVVNMAFDPTTTDQMISILKEVLPSIEEAVWDPLWYVVAALGFLACVFWWGMGQAKKAAVSVAGIILLIGLVPILLSVLPDGMIKVNDVATAVSGKIFAKVAGVDPEQVKQEQQQQQQKQSVVYQKQPDTLAQEMQNRMNSMGIQWYYSSDFEQDLQYSAEVGQAIDQIDDSLWKSFVYESYLIANFGNKDVGTKYFDGLMAKKSDIEARRQYLVEQGKINTSDGTASNADFKVFTQDGLKQRIRNVMTATSFPLIPLIAMMIFAFCVLFWTVMAVAYASLAVVFFLLALWPSYGLREAAHYLYRTFASLLMKIFYSIVLAVFLKVWVALQDSSQFPNLNIGGRIIVIALVIWAYWLAMKVLRNKVVQAKGVFGGESIDAGVNELSTITGGLNRGKSVLVRQGRYQLRQGQQVAQAAGMKVGGTVATKGKQAGQKIGQTVAEKRKSMFRPNQAKLQNNMSHGANQVFRDMVNKKMDPTKESDRQKYIHQRPEAIGDVMEIKDWLNRPVNEQFVNLPDLSSGKVIPPRPPARNTPEYIAWKQSPELQQHWKLYQQVRQHVHRQEYQKYLKQKEEYQKSMFRMFRRRPYFRPPTENRVLMEYRQRLLQQQGKREPFRSA